MRAVGGTVKQEFGAKNIILYAYLSVEALFEHSPKIDMYITRGGRIVTKCGIPWSTITKVRRSDDTGTEINLNPWQASPSSAPAGSKRIRSRDPKGGSPCPPGSNFTDLPLPDGKVITKSTKVELRTGPGHYNMLPRMCTGDSWEQHRQLQMLKGVYKTTPCNYEHKSGKCNKGSKCCFAHSTDDGREIDAEVMPFRFKVYTKLYNDVFPLTFEIRHEIGKMSDEELDEAMLKKDLYQERVEERSQRPRVHDNSRSPRSSPSDRDSRTPDPQRSKGKGKGDAQALMDIDEDSSA